MSLGLFKDMKKYSSNRLSLNLFKLLHRVYLNKSKHFQKQLTPVKNSLKSPTCSANTPEGWDYRDHFF